MKRTENSYEIIDVSDITNVRFYTSIDQGSYIPPHWAPGCGDHLYAGRFPGYHCWIPKFHHHPGDCTLINANVLHSTKCTNPNKAIVLQIPLDFMEKYIPNVQQLLFILDHTSTDPVRSTKTAMLCTVLEQMQIIDEIRPDGFIMRFNSLIFELLFQLYHNFSVKVFQSELSQKKKDLDSWMWFSNISRIITSVQYSGRNFRDCLSADRIFLPFFQKKDGGYFSGISEWIQAFFYLSWSHLYHRSRSCDPGETWIYQL